MNEGETGAGSALSALDRGVGGRVHAADEVIEQRTETLIKAFG